MEIKDFVSILSSSSPDLGGGAASALTASLSSALASMAINLTINKKKYAQYAEQLSNYLDKLNYLSNELLDSIKQDQIAFKPLAEAYKLSKDDPNKKVAIQNGLKSAVTAPYNLIQLLAQVIEITEQIQDICSPLVISDVANCAILAYGSLLASKVNVFINSSLIEEETYKIEIEDNTNLIVDKYSKIALDVYNNILERITKNG